MSAGSLLRLYGHFLGLVQAFAQGHAKGILLKGVFIPSPQAKTLSKAQHFNEPSTPIITRFPSSTGNPDIPDSDPRSNHRGLAIRFQLAETPRRLHTDIIDGIPGSNGEEALEFFTALKNGTITEYIKGHPKAAHFFVAASGEETFARYRIEPVLGVQELSAEEAAAKGSNYLYDGVVEMMGKGPVQFKLTVQIAEEGDVTDDPFVKWPGTRQVMELGTISLVDVLNGNAAQQKYIIFDPIPRIDSLKHPMTSCFSTEREHI
ncbi:uncharacterized protein Triagg1_1660 [Trichoderma aggressivum f. europaeum]|uniref:Catalase core domain-containing protein n=1 Tax=Trichoderma aggressivum f. europaeum TaxID=173218 RepID=A0AAE1M3P8_9HYPO|nr:hypothetical protein Triagg1_1660 [Trichoderma aggressivum f. europaeum]